MGTAVARASVHLIVSFLEEQRYVIVQIARISIKEAEKGSFTVYASRYSGIYKQNHVKLIKYLKMALDMRYADSFHAHQLKNSLRSCFCMTKENEINTQFD